MKSCMIAEKPSVAADIATTLGNFKREKGYFESPNMIITWSVGHLVQLVPPHSYTPLWKAWKRDTLPMIPEQFKLEITKSGSAQFKVIKALITRNDISYLINACDAGREGELIFRYLIQLIGSRLPSKRLWISSLTPSEIKKGIHALEFQAFDEMKYEQLYYAARARSESDWLVGMNASRAVTLGQRKQGNRQVYSIGRVQTPTLALLVRREEEILNFVPQAFWKLIVNFQSEVGGYEGSWFRAEEDRFFKKEEGEAIASLIKNQQGLVINYKKQEKRESPPQLFDLTTLQREMNRRVGFSAAKTLSIAQALYEKHKVITYPRTDSRYLSPDIIASFSKRLQAMIMPEHRETIEAILKKIPHLGGRYINSTKVRDHHAIIPTEVPVRRERLSKDELLVLSAIHVQFIGIFLEDALWEEREAITVVKEESFKSKSRSLQKAGWRILLKSESKEEVRTLPELRKGVAVRVENYRLTEGVTQAPPRHTEGSLLGEMERAGKKLEDETLQEVMKDHGLGTPATRAAILERLKAMKYCTNQGKQLVPTSKGMALVRDLPTPELLSAEMTGHWEFRLLQIQLGLETPDQFMQDMKKLTQQLVVSCYQAPLMKEEVGLKGGSEQETQVKTTKTTKSTHTTTSSVSELTCPLCASPLKENSKAVYCSRWNQDPACPFTVWKTIAGKTLTELQMKRLLQKGQTGLLRGFRSKQKKSFSANLILKDGKVEFEFNSEPEIRKKKDSTLLKHN